MKRSNGEGTIRYRRKGLWEGQYIAGRDDNGKFIRKSVYGRTKAEVLAKLNEMINQLEKGCYIQPQATTVSEWFDTWTNEYLMDVKKSTKNSYVSHGRLYIKPKIGKIELQKLSVPTVQKFINDCSGRLSAKTVKNIYGTLHRCFVQAVRCGIIRSNPCDAAILPRIEQKEMNIIQGEKINEFLSLLPSDEYGNLFFVDLFTGMRQSEIIGLTWDCVDFARGVIKVEKQLRRDHALAGEDYSFSSTKNGQKRVIQPADAVMNVLKRERQKQAQNKLKNGPKFCNEYNLVFTDEFGKHLISVTVYNHLKRLLKSIGLENVRFHDLRHSFATISLENGDDIKTVSANLGHATCAFTLDKYGHVSDQMRATSARRMDNFIKAINS